MGRAQRTADNGVRSVTFAALIVENLALILASRSWRLPVWQTFRQRRNRTLKWILAAAAVLLIAILTVPWLRDAFGFGAMRPADWLAALGAGFLRVAWFGAYKALARR